MRERLQWALMEADLSPVRGSEQAGHRPVLVVSNEEFNQVTSNVTVLPLTSSQRRLYPSEIRLPAMAAGQPAESLIMAHQIRTISKQRLGRALGHLSDPALQEAVRDAVREHLDLDE